MRTFSRHALRQRPRAGIESYLATVALLLVVILLLRLSISEYVGIVLVAASVLFLVTFMRKHHVRRMQARRGDESICTYARSLGRGHDFSVLRAVYEEVQRYTGSGELNYPIRPSDSLEELGVLDDGELEYVVKTICFRCERSQEELRFNPKFGNVVTVSDLVEFVELQPHAPA